jgi:hypothetical protein
MARLDAERLADLELAVPALIPIVRREYPANYRLAQISYIWKHEVGVTDEQIAALDRREEGRDYLWPNSR